MKIKGPDLTADERSRAMAGCMIFALNAFRNKPVYDPDSHMMETWHSWFRRVLTDAGFELTDPEPQPKRGTP